MFSKMIFWIENVLFHISYMILYHLVLIIIVYIQLTINVAKAATLKTKLPAVIIWLIIGPFYLFGCACKDLFYYVKILCDYKEDVNVT